MNLQYKLRSPLTKHWAKQSKHTCIYRLINYTDTAQKYLLVLNFPIKFLLHSLKYSLRSPRLANNISPLPACRLCCGMYQHQQYHISYVKQIYTYVHGERGVDDQFSSMYYQYRLFLISNYQYRARLVPPSTNLQLRLSMFVSTT